VKPWLVGGRPSTVCAVRRALWLIVAAIATAMLFVPAPALADGAVGLRASIDGANLAHATEAHPVQIAPGQPITIALLVRNGTTNAISVGSVNLEGRVAGLTFFSFDTLVRFDVPAGQAKSLAYVLDTTSLKGQATGLVPGSLSLSTASGQLIASLPFVSDIKGSIISVYGLFGLGILVLTVLGFIEALLALARGRLPLNRWRRGIRFLIPGLGVGAILVFSLSAFGEWLPSNGHWFVILAIFGAAGFVIGYLTPTPPVPGEENEDEEEEEEEEELNGPGNSPVSEIPA
jgi:hypothetical protein